MFASTQASEPRVMSEAEIAMVAGGPGGLNSLVNWGNAQWQDSGHTFLISDGTIFADYTHDGTFDEAWRPDANCPSGWSESITGLTWFCGSNGADELEEWLESHPSVHIVEG